jgi:hypothetical protein
MVFFCDSNKLISVNIKIDIIVLLSIVNILTHNRRILEFHKIITIRIPATVIVVGQ